MVEGSDVPVIVPRIFSKAEGVLGGMSTRNGGVSPPPLGMNLSFNVGDDRQNVEKNRALFLGALKINPSAVAYAGQVHSVSVVRVDQPGMNASCDAMMTDRAGVFLAVSVADCYPILLYDNIRRCVAAVHSGWRGSHGKIAQAAIGKLTATYGTVPKDLTAYIGAGAGVCCYEVGEDVAEKFPDRYVDRGKSEKPHLDLLNWNRDLLLESGLDPGNIEVSGECTISIGERYHSYRRDGARSGRMLAVCGII